MGTCGDCKYFAKDIGNWCGHRMCMLFSDHENPRAIGSVSRKAIAEDRTGRPVVFLTRPDFGCNQFKERE